MRLGAEGHEGSKITTRRLLGHWEVLNSMIFHESSAHKREPPVSHTQTHTLEMYGFWFSIVWVSGGLTDSDRFRGRDYLCRVSFEMFWVLNSHLGVAEIATGQLMYDLQNSRMSLALIAAQHPSVGLDNRPLECNPAMLVGHRQIRHAPCAAFGRISPAKPNPLPFGHEKCLVKRQWNAAIHTARSTHSRDEFPLITPTVVILTGVIL